ncbi:hypothetical protein, partial [Gordonia aichiensis]
MGDDRRIGPSAWVSAEGECSGGREPGRTGGGVNGPPISELRTGPEVRVGAECRSSTGGSELGTDPDDA